jgi:alkyl sulfatase BDS1-like metallo-beta-lactamase superfamily hydrolase
MVPADDAMGPLTPTKVFDLMVAGVVPERAEGKSIAALVDLTDTGERYLLTLKDSALSYKAVAADADAEGADLTLEVPAAILLPALADSRTMVKVIAVGRAWIKGDSRKLSELLNTIDRDSDFYILADLS